MESPSSGYIWGTRHDVNGSLAESHMPRDNSVADIAPWAIGPQATEDPSPQSSSPQSYRPPRKVGLNSFSSSSRLRHGSSSLGASTSSQHPPRGNRRRGDSDASQPDLAVDKYEPPKGKSSFLTFIKKKASRSAFAGDAGDVERYGSTSTHSFEEEFGVNPNASFSSQHLSIPGEYSYLRSSPSSSSPTAAGTSLKRSRKASSNKTKQSSLTPIQQQQDTYQQLDINALDMDGIVDPRVNAANSNGGFGGGGGMYESPIDAGRGGMPWDAAGPSSSSRQPFPPPVRAASPPHGGVNGTPFSTLNPFGMSPASPPAASSSRGKGKAPMSISPKEVFPSSSTSDLSGISGYTIPDVSTPTPYSISQSTLQSSSSTLPHINTSTSPYYAHQSQPISPHWQAPDSWATIPRENERLETVGESSDDEYDTGTPHVGRQPSFAPMEAGTSFGGAGTSSSTRRVPSYNTLHTANTNHPNGSTNTFLTASTGRQRDKSLPQTPISPANPTAALDSAAALKQPPASVRIYRSDGKYHVVNCPRGTTVQQMRGALAKKLGIRGETHRLYMREKGRQRALGPGQAPALILHRRMEQAGYEAYDDLDSLGGEDMGFLVRFIFKSASLGAVEVDETSFPNGFEHVDLGERGLETVPIILHRNASQIITLNLSKNPLVDLPQDFVIDCVSLRELRLTHTAIKRLPRSVRQIKSLQWLDISSNRIPDLDHAGLEQIPGLRQIFVQNNRLSNLPSSFAHMLSLKFLNISNNKFEEIPPVICDMPNLVDLDVSFNSISVLTPDLSRLIALERFIVVGNQIKFFPAEIQLMISLRELDCRRNLISDLSPLSALPRLESLLAEHNRVSVLDFVVGGRLQMLNLSNNPTAKSTLRPLLPNSRFSLTSLDLSHLKLSSFDEDGAAFGAFTSLEKLKFDYNDFRSIPDVICTLSELQEFSCTNNNLHDLPENIGMLKKLRVFNVHNNNIKIIPEGIWECESLEELNISSNSLEGWLEPATAPSTSSSAATVVGMGGGALGLSTSTDEVWNEGDEIQRKGSAAGLSITNRTVPPLANSLQRLFLADNYLGVTNRATQFDIFRILSYTRELRVLNLSFNQLNELPPIHLKGFAQLHELYLSGNNLTSLPADFIHRLIRLKVLHLNGNKLQTLPVELGKIAGLETLDVGNNQLKYNVANTQYDWNWNFNIKLKYLNLSGNKRLEIKTNNPPPVPASSSAAVNQTTVPHLFNFSDLSKLRVLGLMDVTLRGASLPEDDVERRVRTSDTEINGMAYGIADTLGTVDGPMTFDLALQKFRGQEGECLFGMFGRTTTNLISSNRAAKFLHEQFPRSFTEALSKSMQKSGAAKTEDIPQSLRATFLALNRSLHEFLVLKGYADTSGRKLSAISMSGPVGNDLKSGASAIVVYIVKKPENKMMYVANVGDMLAVVSQSNGSFEPVSTKHDPFERTEIERIRAAEGWVSPKGMVNEEEDLSRNFGLYHLLPAVNARPDIHSHVLTELDELVIIGNRGLWDYVSYRTAVDIARLNREDPMKAAQMLRDYAMSYGADGNTVIMVVLVSDLFTGGPKSRTAQDENTYVTTRRMGPRPERDRLLRMLDESVTAPTGTLALVFTDIRNSTSLWEKNVGMPLAMKAHNELLRRQARWIGGFEVKTEGDAFMMAFQTVPAAMLWCFKVQTELLHADWPMEILESEEGGEIQDSEGNVVARGLSVRMGIHWGRPVCAEDPVTHRMDYFGPMVNRSARIMSQALGGQITVSQDVLAEIDKHLDGVASSEELQASAAHVEALKRMGIERRNEGERSLKGLETPETVWLVFPSSLRGRLESQVTPSPVASASRTQFSLEQVTALGLLAVRLEALATSRVFRPNEDSVVAHRGLLTGETASTDVPPDGEQVVEDSPAIWRGDPYAIVPKFRADPSDQDLMLALDHLAGRIENALSSITIRTMMNPSAARGGNGLPPRLEDIDPHTLLQAIRIVQGLMAPIVR